MDRRTLLGCAAVGAMLAFGPSIAAPRRKPNFIIIYTDDLGYGDTNLYGNDLIRTPNIGALGSEGTVLTNYYAPANLCTPSRAGLITGRYPIRAGLSYVLRPASQEGLSPTQPTIPKLLKPAGYTSAHIGKWHMGEHGQYWPPTVHGYDYFYGIPHSHDQWPLSISEARADQVRDEQILDVKNLQEQFYIHGEQFIEENASKPFFVNMSFSSPHHPSWVPDKFVGATKAGEYGDTIAELDSFVGRLMKKLRDLKIDRDTMVIFTSDNGPWFWGSSGGLRDRKSASGYDGGYKVPFVARLPGVIKAGQRSDAIASGIDILPMLCRLAGAALPTVPIDGVDMTPVLASGAPAQREEIVLWSGEDLVGIRTQRWKYLENLPSARYGYTELYDMRADPTESYNVRSMHPEVVADMKRRFDRAKALFDPMRLRPKARIEPTRFLGDPRSIWPD